MQVAPLHAAFVCHKATIGQNGNLSPGKCSQSDHIHMRKGLGGGSGHSRRRPSNDCVLFCHVFGSSEDRVFRHFVLTLAVPISSREETSHIQILTPGLEMEISTRRARKHFAPQKGPIRQKDLFRVLDPGLGPFGRGLCNGNKNSTGS